MAQKMMKRMPSGIEEGLEKMSPTEELAVEHGQLTRILLAVDNVLSSGKSIPKASLGPVSQACKMIRQSVVDHHMKIEEELVYPKFEGTELADCASTLRVQHDEARRMLSCMEDLAKSGAVKSKGDMEQLRTCFNDFKDMLTAHAAFEETVVFPFMEGNWSEKELNSLREAQEKDEKKLLGDDAAQKTYDMLTSLESSCGVTGLRDYTRRMK